MAVVDGKEITRQELAREALRRYGKEVLESLLNKHLILQACRKYNMTVTEQDVEAEIERMAKKFGLSTQRWLAMLEEERQIKPDQYRRDIIWPTLALRRLAAKQLTVSDEELRQAWEASYGQKVQVRMISVIHEKKAEEIHAMAMANPDQFGRLAKDHSEDRNGAATRGLIPPFGKHTGEPEVWQAAFALKKGEISPVIHVANQYLILKCEAHFYAPVVLNQQKEQLLAGLREKIRDRKLRGAATEVFKRLQEQSKVVNVYNDPKLRGQMPGIAATIDDQRITVRQLSEECISRHGVEVLDGEINRLLLTQELRRRKLTVTEDDIDEEIGRAAIMYGFMNVDGTADVNPWIEHVTKESDTTVELYVRDVVWPSAALKKLVAGDVKITDEDLRKAYEANYGERVEVMAIVLDNQRRAVEVWEMARVSPSEEFFGKLAGEYSVEPASKANLGRVPPIRRYTGQRLVEDEAFSLEPGELSGVIAIGDKYIIMRCIGRDKPESPELEEVRSNLYADIEEKKQRIAMSKKFDELQQAAQIENFLAGTRQPGSRRTTATGQDVTQTATGSGRSVRR